MSKQLIPVEKVNAVELFQSEDTLQAFLEEVRNQAIDFDADISTSSGRAKIASQAYKVSQSKTVIDSAGKALTTEWARKKKVVDSGRRAAREFCDSLRDEIRQPLNDYEEEQRLIAEEAARKEELKKAELEAHAEHDVWLRELSVRQQEEKLAAEKEERERIERQQREAKEKAEREEKIRKDAAEKAQREAEEAVEQERLRAEQAETERVEAEKRAEQAAKDAAEQAEREKQEAIALEKDKAKREAQAKEKERLRIIEQNELDAQRRAADTENRRKINNKAVKALVGEGISEKSAKAVITLIAKGEVPAVSIRY